MKTSTHVLRAHQQDKVQLIKCYETTSNATTVKMQYNMDSG
jgi:hypothetical protein